MAVVVGIVVAGGDGRRFAGATGDGAASRLPKQFLPLGGARVVDHAVAAMRPWCRDVVVVLPTGVVWDGAAVHAAVAGGASRAASVRAGIAACDPGADIVVVHDAARPLASARLFEAVIAAVSAGADAAVPVVALADTIKRVAAGHVVETLDREGLVAVQTPQAFRVDALRSAHARLPEATDDAAVVEAAGGTVVTVAGDPRNLKVTTPDDLALAVLLLEATTDAGNGAAS